MQAKENSYKEEFLKQLKLADRRGPSPTSNMMMQQLVGGVLSHLDHYSQPAQATEAPAPRLDALSEEDRLKFEKAQLNVGEFLDELTNEQAVFNYSQAPVAETLTKTVAEEMKAFCKQLMEKKLNQPRDLHTLPPSGLAFTLGDANGKY